MKNIKKILAVTLAVALVGAAFVGCGKKDAASSSLAPGQENPTVAQGENAVMQLPEDFNLTDEQMTESVAAYVEVLSGLCSAETADLDTGKQITALALNVHEDNTVTFDATTLDADGQESTATAYSFNSMKEAFAYLFASGCLDAQGNLLVTGTDVAENTQVPVDADSEADGADAEDASSMAEAESRDAGAEDASSTTESLPESVSAPADDAQ